VELIVKAHLRPTGLNSFPLFAFGRGMIQTSADALIPNGALRF
jgi:hypothetical protein